MLERVVSLATNQLIKQYTLRIIKLLPRVLYWVKFPYSFLIHDRIFVFIKNVRNKLSLVSIQHVKLDFLHGYR